MNKKVNQRLWIIGSVILAIALLLYWLVITLDLSAYWEGGV